jgi:L-lactate dehydrogenase (FMN-dependent) and related alpha-hydroxy acid dehydrogenases
MEDRKKDHIDLAFNSQAKAVEADRRFYYEPLMGSHTRGRLEPFTFLGKTMRLPVWVSSMTGGTALAKTINTNLARACNEFGMGMGLGSCRMLLENEAHFADFDMRDIIGDDLPFYANIGIAQLEQMLENKSHERLLALVDRLRADGLIIHVNPIQEWLQPEGDLLHHAPYSIIEEFLSLAKIKVIVKEVGQGIGPVSLRKIMWLPIEALEFAAFGGTNFARVELARCEPVQQELYEPLSLLGHSAEEMLNMVNGMVQQNQPLKCKQLIISGGVKSFLDGFYLLNRSKLPAIYGQASGFLKYARGDYNLLKAYVEGQAKGLLFAKSFLQVRD